MVGYVNYQYLNIFSNDHFGIFRQITIENTNLELFSHDIELLAIWEQKLVFWLQSGNSDMKNKVKI